MSFFNEDGSLKANATRVQMASGFLWACQFGRDKVIEFLLDKGVDVATEAHGMTGRHLAIVGADFRAAQVSLDRQAPLAFTKCDGGDALRAATRPANRSDPAHRWPDPKT